MTLEQNEAWHKAILEKYPLEKWSDYRNATSTLASMMPKAEYRAFLKGCLELPFHTWDIPGWAVELRNVSIGWSLTVPEPWEEPWLFDFALRSEVALVGLQFRHPTQKARVEAYRRLLIDFLTRGSKIFVDWMEAEDDEGKLVYHDIAALYELIHGLSVPRRKVLQRFLECRDPAQLKPRYRKLHSYRLLEILHTVLFQEPEQWWNTPDMDLARRFLELLPWDIEPDFLFQAYLSALEAECPPPDWIGMEPSSL